MKAAKEELSAAFEVAASLADEVPEHYRERAFELAVRYFMDQSPSDARPMEPVRKARSGSQETAPPAIEGTVEAWTTRVVEGLPEAHVVTESGSRAHQAAYAVISLLKAGESARVEDVRKFLRAKLGVSPESPSNTSDRLKSLVPRYLSREQAREGRAFEYKPTAKALEVFSDLEP